MLVCIQKKTRSKIKFKKKLTKAILKKIHDVFIFSINSERIY